MKKLAFISSLVTFFCMLGLVSFSQSGSYEIRIAENDLGYMEVQMRETTGGSNLPSNTDGDKIGDLTFAIRWSDALGTDVNFLCSANFYNITDPGGTVLTDETGWHYRYYNAVPAPFDVPVDWVLNEWEIIATFITSGGIGTGTFEIAPQNFGISTLNFTLAEAAVPPYFQYLPTINGSASSYSYPTLVYDYVWVGGGQPAFESDWFFGGNWATECGVTPVSGPTAANNVLIPDISGESGYFPNSNLSGTMSCNNLRINNGAIMTVPAINGSLVINGDFVSNGTLTIIPDANATVAGDTYLGAAESLVVEATGDGVGSFLDNGTITYGASGTAKVQAYLSNDASPGFFHIHMVGPMADMANYTGPGTGALLGAFDVAPGFTYAYEYDEPTALWVNLVSLGEEIPTTKGIALSTTDGFDKTLEMTGELITGPVSSDPLSYTGPTLGDNLLSNPYPSSIFWNDMYGYNTGNVNDIVRVWDGNFGGGNYRAYNQGSGGTDDFTGYIQIGQGFFVESTGTNTFDFNNTQRHHSTDPFFAPQTTYMNRLDVRVEGSQYRDGLLIHFYEDALDGFEPNEDARKVESRYDEAPEIWTDLDDDIDLSINALPIDLLGSDMFSVPMSFKCGYAGTYTLSFIDLESFETGTEVWLEDKQTGDDWVSINNNPEYVFNAFPAQLKDRFVIHFFGPTGINELAGPTVSIYSFGNNAYVVNDTEERIKQVQIYNLTGELIFNEKVPDQRINKFYVSDKLGYFIVKVITDEHIYLEKVMISYY